MRGSSRAPLTWYYYIMYTYDISFLEGLVRVCKIFIALLMWYSCHVVETKLDYESYEILTERAVLTSDTAVAPSSLPWEQSISYRRLGSHSQRSHLRLHRILCVLHAHGAELKSEREIIRVQHKIRLILLHVSEQIVNDRSAFAAREDQGLASKYRKDSQEHLRHCRIVLSEKFWLESTHICRTLNLLLRLSTISSLVTPDER